MGATANNITSLLTANPTCGIKIFMGSSHGMLLVNREELIESIVAEGKHLIVIHAEDQARILARCQEYAGNPNPAVHSQIQDNIAVIVQEI